MFGKALNAPLDKGRNLKETSTLTNYNLSAIAFSGNIYFYIYISISIYLSIYRSIYIYIYYI